MFELLNGAMQDRFFVGLPTNATTDYVPTGGGSTGSSDLGKLMMGSSNMVMCAGTPNANPFSVESTTIKTDNRRLIGILTDVICENDESTCSTNASTSVKYFIQPICRFDLLRVDYSTASTDSTAASTNEPKTTDIGKYYHLCKSSNSTNAALAAVKAGYLDLSQAGVNVPDSSAGWVFKLQDFSTVEKKAEVVFDYISGYSS